MKEAKWNKEFDVGVEEIDNAHREFLSAMKRISGLMDGDDPEQSRAACIEETARLGEDLRRHFAEEEAYMQSINYEGYERHKLQHDRARDDLLSGMEREALETNYDADSVLQVLGRVLGWMTGHVPEDMTITGKGFQKTIPVMSDYVSKMELVITDVVRGMFHMRAELLDEHYTGQDIGDAVYHELHYLSDKEDRKVRFLVVTEKQLLEVAVGSLLSKSLHGLNQMVLSAVKEINHMIFQEAGTYFRDEVSHFTLVYENILTAEEVQSRFNNELPFYGLLFKTSAGRFAICFDIYG